MADDDVTELGSLLAGEVDGAVDELAAYILASPWLAQRDARIRAETLRDAAVAADADPTFRDPLRLRADWLPDRADRIEREGQP